MSHHFKWFLALSVTAHAVVLFAWVAPIPEAGNPGQVLLLDVMDKTGQVASLPAIDAENSRRRSGAKAEHPVSTHKPVYTARNQSNAQPVKPDTSTPATQEPGAPAPTDMQAQNPANLAASSPLPSRKESDRHLRASVLELVTTRLDYPVIARSKGWQGIVILELHIEADGLISNLQVNETSGYLVLDQAAVESLQMASIPGARQWLHGHSIDMLIPVEYRLLDS